MCSSDLVSDGLHQWISPANYLFRSLSSAILFFIYKFCSTLYCQVPSREALSCMFHIRAGRF